MIRPAAVDAPELDAILWKDFPPGAVGYDVGANCGQTINKILEIVDEVIAFEPAVEALEYLTEHFGTRSEVALSEFAVTDHDGTVDLVAAPSKIETGQLVTHGTHGMEWSEDEMQNGVVRTLPAITLDTFADEHSQWPDFIKIDVEGHEVAVLSGAEHILATSRPHMLIEVHSENLGKEIERMLSPSYLLDVVRHPHYATGTTLWKSHFWIRCFPLEAGSET